MSIRESFEVLAKRNDLEYLVEELAKARQKLHETKAEKAAFEAKIEARYKLVAAAHQNATKSAQGVVDQLEIDVKRVTVRKFQHDPSNKRPHPECGIRVTKVLVYDDVVALDYSKQHIPKAVKPAQLIKPTFEKAAKVLDLEFVEIREEPRATISRNLSRYLPREEV